MPRIGNVDVSDDFVGSLSRVSTPAAGERPSLGAVLGAAAQGAYGQLRYGLPYQAAKLAGTATPADEAFYKQGLDAARTAASAAAPAQVSDLTSGRVGIGRFIGENLAASLPYMAGAAAGGIAGFVRGGEPGAAFGAIAAGIPQFSASNVDRAVQEQGGLSGAAAAKALAVAPFQAASDAAIGRYLPGAGHVIGDLAATQTGGFLRRTAVSMAKAGGTEAITEAAQQVGERYAAGVPLTTADAAAEYTNAAVTAFALGGALGAGGGFRRHTADAKPADQVTAEDMTAKIDGILDGSLRALPAPADIHVGPDGISRVNPSGNVQLALPSPEMLRGPDFVTDSEGNTAPAGITGEQALAAERNQPQPAAPTVEDALARFDQQRLGLPAPDAFGRGPQGPEIAAQPGVAQTDAAGRTVMPNELFGADVSADGFLRPVVGGTEEGGVVLANTPRPVEGAPPPRPFATKPIAAIQTAIKDKNTEPAVREAADAEVAARRAEALGQAPLTADNYQSRVDDLKHGLRGGWVQKLTAADPQDLIGKVYTEVFENQNTASNVQKFAQRVGLLDEKLEPTAAAQQITDERTAAAQAEAAAPPAAPQVAAQSASTTVDPEFASHWDGIKQQAGINRNRNELKALGSPPNLEAAQAQVFRALADDTSNAQVSQVEKLARTMGLVTNDDAMDVTPLGRKAFLRTPEGLQETVSAAQQQGHTGAQASIFDRGVQAQLTGVDQGSHTSFADMAAYEAGKVWAQDFVNTPTTKTAAQTDAIRARQASRKTGVAATTPVEARPGLTPEQTQQAALNRLIDAADLRSAPDSDIATLRRMIRDGASSDAVGQALQQVQGGKTLFKEAAGPSVDGFSPSVPTRGGQPRFVELRSDPVTARSAGLLNSKGEMRAETENAVHTYNLRQAIQQGVRDGVVTEKRAAKLNALLDDGKVDQVARVSKDIMTNADKNTKQATLQDRRETDRGVTRTDAKLEQAITGKSFGDVADHMIAEAPSVYHRTLMRGVKGLMTKLERAGVKFDFKVVGPGDTVPATLLRDGVRGLAETTRVPPTATVYLKSSEMGSDGGVSYETAAHEMIHAVTMTAVDYYSNRAVAAGDKLGAAVRDLEKLAKAIATHFETRLSADADRGAPGSPERHFSRPVLTEIERRFAELRANALANTDEILAWGLTNPEMQRYLATIQYEPRKSVFGRLVELVRKLLQIGDKGIEVRHDTALAELLRVSEQIMDSSQSELTMMIARNRHDGFDTGVLSAAMQQGTAENISAANRTVDAANTATKDFASTVTKAVDAVASAGLPAKARRLMMGALSLHHLVREYGHLIPGLNKLWDAKLSQGAVHGRFSHIGSGAYRSFEALMRADRPAAERVGKLMSLATEFQIDPDKAWADHEHLGISRDANGNATVAAGRETDAARLEPLHREAVKLKNDLSRGDGAGIKVFNDFRKLNEAQNLAHLAAGLHSSVAMDPELALGVAGALENPVDNFMVHPDLETAEQVHGFWDKALTDQVEAVKAFIDAKKGEVVGATPSEQEAMAQHISPIESQIAAVYAARASMARAPYFHLGRFGDFFGSAVMRADVNGVVDPKSQQVVSDALEKAGFTGIQMSADNTRPRFTLRFQNEMQAKQFGKLMLELQRQGHLSQDTIEAGPRERSNNYGAGAALAGYVQKHIQAIETSPMFTPAENATAAERAALEKRKQDAIRLAVDTWVETTPDNSISKVLAKRYTVPGYDADMTRSWAHRWNVGSISLASVATAPKYNDAYNDMRAHARNALDVSNQHDPVLAADILSEVKKRDASQPVNELADTFDKARAVAHSYFLGLSPAYGLVNMTQMGVVALPELAKQHGYSKSFHAMRRATPIAFAIIKAAAKEAIALGPKHAADLTITTSAMKAAGLNDVNIEFVRRMIANGSIDIGSAARAFGQIAESGGGSKMETALKYASAVGLYTETASRLITALAAHDLHGGIPADSAKYATDVVSDSLFNFQSWAAARQLSKQGFAGPATPLLTQFMAYSLNVTEKIYSEVHAAIGKPRPGESAESAALRAAQSRRFLLGHLTAVTALAGTLGLPFASVFAAAIERLVDSMDGSDDPYDATASWRGFLASVLGKDVAEVVSRGLPRALGVDLSARAGEQNLLPGSEFLTDRRPWAEAVSANAGRSLGAVPSMINNIVSGGGMIADGDVLGGMKAMLPVALKGPLETYRMTSEGYVDTKGNKLPIMTPGASAILWQLIGFSPAQRAEYSEARSDQQAVSGQTSRDAGALRTGITRALLSGDQETAHSLVQQAIKFDKDNPTDAVLPSLAGSLQRVVQARAQAQALHAPLGVKPEDIAGQRLTSYANVNYGP